MAKDPMFSNRTSPNGATAPNDPLNQSHKRYFRGYNKFNLTRQFYNTERYADINLVEVLNGVEGDKLPFGNKHYIRSYTMKSPTMFELYKKKTYFAVNNQAILPINWKKIYKQPNKGDDVYASSVNSTTMLLEYTSNLITNLRNFSNFYSEESSDEVLAKAYTFVFKSLLFLESVYSDGSLLSSMNCHLSSMYKGFNATGRLVSFDGWLEYVFEDSMLNHFQVRFDDSLLNGKIFSVLPLNETIINISKRSLLDLMRTSFDWEFYPNTHLTWDVLDRLCDHFYNLTAQYVGDLDGPESLINIERLIAYQLVCAQFYTKDSVDNIYTASDFIDNAKSLVSDVVSFAEYDSVGYSWPTFQYNGSRCEYDVFSGFIVDTVLNYVSLYAKGDFSDYSLVTPALNFLHMIFFYRKSLRYGDYFLGAKTLPYAPMDVTADVVGNGVSALDMTRSIIAQRFANLVERARNTWNDYLKDVTGGVASPTPFEPRFLANSTSRVDGFEVENTAENQGNVVTLLKSGNSNYMYEVEVNEPMIIIGVSTYGIPRVYSKTVSRFFRKVDRFDMFNKSFQNIGDQEIFENERSANLSTVNPYGYTPRNIEYKQRYPIAAGGFVENLPGYAFIADNNASDLFKLEYIPNTKINSFLLRNVNDEFDRFYSSLSGLTLASYFHFIVKYDLICHATRQMEYAPDIL